VISSTCTLGQEVGRSCIYVEYMDRRVLLDCGVHPAKSGIAGMPFLDEIEPAKIDLVLISQSASTLHVRLRQSVLSAFILTTRPLSLTLPRRFDFCLLLAFLFLGYRAARGLSWPCFYDPSNEGHLQAHDVRLHAHQVPDIIRSGTQMVAPSKC